MVHKVVIKDNGSTPIHYLSGLNAFKNGTEYTFKAGINIIVGENGCGKTTLMNLIKKYLLVDYTECSKGKFNSNINALFKDIIESKGFYGGVDVYADYNKNTFRLSHVGEKERMKVLETADDFATAIYQNNASTGEGVIIAMQSLFEYMFSSKAKLTFDYSQFKESHKEYIEYIDKHRMKGDEYTILMDEPDRNLSLENLSQIRHILSFHKPETQIITVIHNPLLIYSLSKKKSINFIEMTEGYIDKVKEEVNKLIGRDYDRT